MKETREPKKGFPYARGRHMSGGTLMCFAFYETKEECEIAIANIPAEYVKQFVIYLPHLDLTQTN